jgi:hypothetical protein
MYDGYVRTTRVLIRQEIMEILSLRSNAMLLPPIFYFSSFAMNIKATCSFISPLASDTCILSKQLIKTLSNCTKSKINNHLIMVCNHGNGKFLMFDSWAIVQFLYPLCRQRASNLYIQPYVSNAILPLYVFPDRCTHWRGSAIMFFDPSHVPASDPDGI